MKKDFLFSILIHFSLFIAVFALFSWKNFFWRGGHSGGDSVTWIDLKGGTQSDGVERLSSPGLSGGSRWIARTSPKGASRAMTESESSHLVSGFGNQTHGPGLDNQGSDVPSVLAMIRRRILAARHYPEVARQAGIEGAALVGFEIGPDGGVLRLVLRRSSGSGILDEEALATIRRAAPFPVYPGEILIPVNYALEDE